VSQMALTFDAPPLARNSDPATSHQAASQARELQADHYRLILATLRRHGALGKDGIASRCGLTAYQVSKRLTELDRLGAIRATGETVRSTAGRSEREWIAA
jgi:predicted ArsR family transcriptional regulator